MRVYQPNLLIVSGSGQNTGKTTLVCRIIGHFGVNQPVVGVKITHHQKSLTYEIPMLASSDQYVIYREQNDAQPKDSSRMLRAGAKSAYFIIAAKHAVGEAMKALLPFIDAEAAIVCESGGLADFYEPGVHLHILGNEDNGKPFRIGDFVVRYDGFTFNLNLANITFKNQIWKFI